MLLLDQRGTGRSTPLTFQTLATLGSPQAQADYLKHFRADSIVRDAELIRRELLGEAPLDRAGAELRRLLHRHLSLDRARRPGRRHDHRRPGRPSASRSTKSIATPIAA